MATRFSKKAEAPLDEQGNRRITDKFLVDLCDETGLYTTPNLNEKLFISHRSLSRIENLEKYTSLKALYLDNNAFNKIENISHLTNLQCLYLQNNQIQKIEGLETLVNLRILNLSNNQIKKVEGLSKLKRLENLDLSKNDMKSTSAIEHLVECPSLTNVDLSDNPIELSEDLLPLLSAIKSLACLYLKNTPIKKDLGNYRKKIITSIPNIKFLDERPVDEKELRLANAFIKGGKDGEATERKKIAEEKQAVEDERKQERQQNDEKAKARRRREFERIYKEVKEERAKLIKMKEDYIEKKPPNWEMHVESCDKRIARLDEELSVKELLDDVSSTKDTSGRGDTNSDMPDMDDFISDKTQSQRDESESNHTKSEAQEDDHVNELDELD